MRYLLALAFLALVAAMPACERAFHYEPPPAGSYEAREYTLKVGQADGVVRGAAVLPSFFPATKVRPMLGRLFIEPEHHAGAPAVAVISHDLWERRFSTDPSVIGRQIQVDANTVVIVGVAPPGFTVPGATELWIPKRQ